MSFKELLTCAKSNDVTALNEILGMYKPLLGKESVVDGVLDEDLYQELCLTLLNCVKVFRV